MKRRDVLRMAAIGLGLQGLRRVGVELHGRGPSAGNASTPDALALCCADTSEGADTGWVDYAPLFESGSYRCAVCGQVLFDSEDKYEAHTPWPSFWQAVSGAVVPVVDRQWGQIAESAVACSACQAPLGDVYRDGPPPTGLRYCIRSAALVFEPQGS